MAMFPKSDTTENPEAVATLAATPAAVAGNAEGNRPAVQVARRLTEEPSSPASGPKS